MWANCLAIITISIDVAKTEIWYFNLIECNQQADKIFEILIA